MLRDQCDAFIYDTHEKVRLLIAFRVNVPDAIGEAIKEWRFVFGDTGLPQLLQTIDCFSKEITLEALYNEALDHLLHLVDGIVHSVNLTIADHRFKVRDGINT